MSEIAEFVSAPYILTRGFTGRSFRNIVPAETITAPPPVIVQAPVVPPSPATVYDPTPGGLQGYGARQAVIYFDIVSRFGTVSTPPLQYAMPHFNTMMEEMRTLFEIYLMENANGTPIVYLKSNARDRRSFAMKNPAEMAVQSMGGSFTSWRHSVWVRMRFKAGTPILTATLQQTDKVTEGLLYARVSLDLMSQIYGGAIGNASTTTTDVAPNYF